MDKKTIWLINQYASTPETGIGGRHYLLAKEMAKNGHTVYVVAASFSHILHKPADFLDKFKIAEIDNLKFVWIKTSVYPHAHSKKRVLNWLIFAWRLLSLNKIIQHKPEAILYSSPSLFGFFSAWYLARINHCSLTFEVRDIWPLSLIEVGGLQINHPFIRLMQWTEDKAYSLSDHVVSNLPNANVHMVARGMKPEKFTWIPNGLSLDDVSNGEELPEQIAELIPKNKFIIGYAGTLGVANAVHVFINAAELLKTRSDICFVVAGNGLLKDKLKEMATNKNLSNIVFLDAVAKNRVQSLLSSFDVCYLGLGDKPLFKYGIASNKLFEYFWARKPIIYSINSGSYQPVSDANAGISVSAENPRAVADAVLTLQALDSKQRKILGENGRAYAEKNHNYSLIAEKLVQTMFAKNEKTI